MDKKVIFFILMLLSAFVIVSGCITSTTEDIKSELPENLDYKIDISGGTNGNITLTYADLKAMDFVKKSQISYKDSTGNSKVSDFIGIEWNDVLEKGGIPAGEVYFKVYSPDSYNVIYTKDQADETILAFIENDKALTTELKNDPVHLVYINGMQCHWVTLPVKIEIYKTNPDKAAGTTMDKMNDSMNTTLNTNSIKGTWIDAQVSSENVSFPVKSIDDNTNIHLKVNTEIGEVAIMAYKLDDKIFVRSNACPPCNSTGFSLNDDKLVCDACGTVFDAATGLGIEGGCMDYPKENIPYTISEGNIILKIDDVVTAHKKTVEIG